MVLLAKWILENNPNARVAIITDRDELDKQIERVFTEAGEPIKRTSSGRDLMSATRPGKAASAVLAGSQVRQEGRGQLRRSSSRNWRPSPARPWERYSSSWTSATAHKAASCTA